MADGVGEGSGARVMLSLLARGHRTAENAVGDSPCRISGTLASATRS